MPSAYGPVVRNGEIHHLSASGLTKGDPSQEGGCFRKWLYHYVLGEREPERKHHIVGKQTHKVMEDYYLTGVENFNPLALSARHLMPPRVPECQRVEHELIEGFKIENIPVVGYIDLLNWSLRTTDEHGDPLADLPGVVEVLDWKTTKNILRYAKRGIDLIKTDQMSLYGKYVLWRSEYKARPRLSHVYMQTSGMAAATKATDLPDPSKIERRWDEMSAVARTLKDVVRETDPAKVPANRNACPAFGQCSYYGKCPRTSEQTLIDIFGVTKAEGLKGKTLMSLESQMQSLQQEQAAAGNPMAPPPPAGITDQQFKEAWDLISSVGRGFPPVNADGAAYLARINGWESHTAQAGYAGQGEFGTLQSLSAQQVMDFANNLRATTIPAPAASTPPAPPVTTVDVPPAVVITHNAAPQTPPSAPVVSPPPQAPSAPETAPSAEPEEVTQARELAQDPKWTGQKMNKGPLAKVVRYLLENGGGGGEVREVIKEVIKEVPVASPEADSGQLIVYVDCIPSCPADSLDEYILGKVRELEAATGARDIRCSDHKALDFGAWKGSLATMVRESPPEPGVYTVDTQSEIWAIAAQELRGIASIYVRGTK